MEPKIRKNITPIGDGNEDNILLQEEEIINKIEYNSDRRRKL